MDNSQLETLICAPARRTPSESRGPSVTSPSGASSLLPPYLLMRRTDVGDCAPSGRLASTAVLRRFRRS